jgi:hypothetical protein
MASCYRCGAPNANYRRTTYTGFSTSSWTSKRSYGSGSRTYYGVRSVCEECAKSIDRWSTIKAIFWIVVIIIAFFYFFNGSSNSTKRNKIRSTYEYSGPTARVISVKGLNLRSEGSSTASVILTVPYDEIVGILNNDGAMESISGKEARWFEVDYRGTTGWLWSGYLEEK